MRGLQPHRIETFKLSTDPDFVAKVHDVVGLYVTPPERAVVLWRRTGALVVRIARGFVVTGV
jgi:hypothetical protein